MKSIGDDNKTGTLPRVTTNSNPNPMSRCFTMSDPCGFHLRPATIFAATLQQYDADIMVRKKGGPSVNGKSVMGLLTLGAMAGDEIEITASGPDTVITVSAIERLFACEFDPVKIQGASTPNPTVSELPAEPRQTPALVYA